MRLVSLPLTGLERGLQTKYVFRLQGECVGNVPSHECGEPRKLSDETWERFRVAVNGCAGGRQSKREL